MLIKQLFVKFMKIEIKEDIVRSKLHAPILSFSFKDLDFHGLLFVELTSLQFSCYCQCTALDVGVIQFECFMFGTNQ